MRSLRVIQYQQTLDAMNERRDAGDLTPDVEELFLEQLDDLWNELSVSEVREVEDMYPQLRVRKYG